LRVAAATMFAFAFAAACGGGQVTPDESPVATPAEPTTVTVALRFVEGPEDEASATPSTRVLLVDIDEARGRQTTDLGTYAGVCSHLAVGEDVLLAAQCFWAGEGSRLEVARDGDRLVATRVTLDAERDDVAREELARIALPPSAEIELLAPTTRLGAIPSSE